MFLLGLAIGLVVGAIGGAIAMYMKINKDIDEAWKRL